MIRIQNLKQPKESSGHKLDSGKSVSLKGVDIKNNNKFTIYVDAYQRKKYPVKPPEKLVKAKLK